MKEMTREEIDERLKSLRESIKEKPSYNSVSDILRNFEYQKPAMAMCYSIHIPDREYYYNVRLRCSNCNRVETKKVTEEILEKILNFVDEKILLSIEYVMDTNFKSFSSYKNSITYDEYKKLEEKRREENFNEDEYLFKKYEEDKKFYLATEKVLKFEKELKYNKMLKERDSYIHKFRNVGLEAEIKYYCDNTQISSNPEYIYEYDLDGYFKVLLKAKNEPEFNESFPNITRSRVISKDRMSTYSEYEIALRFLTINTKNQNLPKIFDYVYNDLFRNKNKEEYKGRKKIDFSKIKDFTEEIAFDLVKKDIAETFKEKEIEFEKDRNFNFYDRPFYRFKRLFYDNYTRGNMNYKDINANSRNDIGLIKTKVDIALKKVLGFKIFYTKKEIVKNLSVIFEANGLKDQLDIALQLLKNKKGRDFENCSNFREDILRKKYEEYLKQNGIVSYEDFYNNLHILSNEFVSKEDLYSLIYYYYHFCKEQLKEDEFVDFETFEKDFINKNVEVFRTEEDLKDYFESFAKHKYFKYLSNRVSAKQIKDEEEFYECFVKTDEYQLSLKDYLDFVDGLSKVLQTKNYFKLDGVLTND